MNRVASFMLSALGLAMLSSSVGAEDTGFYVGASVGQASQDVSAGDGMNVAVGGFGFVVHIDPESIDTEKDVTGWDLAIGYRINRFVAGELGYLDFGSAEVTERYDTSGFSSIVPTRKPDAILGNGLGRLCSTFSNP